MHSIRSIFLGLGILILSSSLHAQSLATAPDSIVQLTAEAQELARIAPENVPPCGTFWLFNPNGVLSPNPCPPFDSSLPIYQLADSQYLVDATGGQVTVEPELAGKMSAKDALSETLAAQAQTVVDLIQQAQAAAGGMAKAARFGMADMESFEMDSSALAFDTNGLWLELTDVSLTTAAGILHHATNQVYALWGTTNLALPFAEWQMLQEVFPTVPEAMLFTVSSLSRDTLFLRAQDWTDVTTNGNTTPNWWLWKYFGTTALADSDLDVNGHPLVEDYTNSQAPAVFQFFAVEVTNLHVNTMSVPVQLDVTGQPYYLAVSVDGTNDANAADWKAYAGPNLTVNLGLTEGWHDVWIGLRGHDDDPTNAVWQWTRLKLDYTPPVLVITNPATSVVAQPVIQLQGYSLEPLASLSYDLTNANGLTTNQPLFITGQNFDTNTWEFTTNAFQGFDIPLTNGLNVITLRATDEAGNLTVTNFSFTLDYAGKTNPPALQLFWPLNELAICGSDIICRGSVNDQTVTVAVQLVDAGGAVHTAAARVGRNGLFYADPLTLTAGTNHLSFTATDAAGNVATTNLMVTTSELGLTLDLVSAGQSLVTGTINDTNYAIYANGVLATNNGDGTWSATITPIGVGGGAVVVNAVAGSDPSLQQIVPPPQAVYLVTSTHRSREDFWGSQYFEDESGWADAAGGWLAAHWFDGSKTWADRVDWPASPWPIAVPEGLLWITNNGHLYATTLRPASLSFHYASKNLMAADPVTGSSFRELAEGALEFASGGPAGSVVQRLYQFSGKVTIHHRPQPPDEDTVPWAIPANDETVTDARVTLGNVGTLDANGQVYALVADNARVVVTPSVKGSADYSFYSPDYSEVTLTGLTVVSNAPVDQIDATNWACIKTATDDWVYVQATLSTTDTNAANQIQWTGGEAVPGNPFQRRVTKTISDKTTVTATLGSTSTNLNVWVIWSTVTKFNNYGPADTDTLAIPPVFGTSDTLLNGMLMQFTITPAGAGDFTQIHYDIRRTRESGDWAKDAGVWEQFIYDPPGTDDDKSNADEDLIPSRFGLDHVYVWDTPGFNIAPIGDEEDVQKISFIEWNTVNFGSGWQKCSENYPWHSIVWLQQGSGGNMIRKNSAPNEIKPGAITVGTANNP